MSDERLLKCPFCGGEAWLREFTGLNKSINYYVECGYIECAVSPETAIFETPEEAVAAWNNRKPVDDVLERLGALVEKCMNNSEKAAELGKAYEKHMIFNGAKGNAFEEAIEIIKENCYD